MLVLTSAVLWVIIICMCFVFLYVHLFSSLQHVSRGKALLKYARCCVVVVVVVVVI